MDLKDKVVLVTGSSSGIGRAIAIECAKAGAVVLIHYRSNKEGAEETLKKVEEFSKCKTFYADLSKLEQVEKLFEEIEKYTPEVDLLVNNAGRCRSGKFDDLKMWESQFQDNFYSTLNTSNVFLKQKNKGKLRKIVNISSIYGDLMMNQPDYPQYCAAKAAVSDLTIAMAKKLAPDVLINAIAPGYTWTPPWEGSDPKELKVCAENNKIKRFVDPEEIATVVVEILKNDAIAGEIIRIDGGLHLFEVR
jgi:NAD(P)-dependent dehydrogenase (short-subunit alcohol dehydrogenase family)